MLTMVRPRVISVSMAFTWSGSVNSSCPDTRLWQHTTSKHACLISSHHSLSCSRGRYRLLAKFLRTIAKKAGGANKQNTHLWGNFTFVSHSSHKSSISNSQLHCNFEESCVWKEQLSWNYVTDQAGSMWIIPGQATHGLPVRHNVPVVSHTGWEAGGTWSHFWSQLIQWYWK